MQTVTMSLPELLLGTLGGAREQFSQSGSTPIAGEGFASALLQLLAPEAGEVTGTPIPPQEKPERHEAENESDPLTPLLPPEGVPAIAPAIVPAIAPAIAPVTAPAIAPVTAPAVSTPQTTPESPLEISTATATAVPDVESIAVVEANPGVTHPPVAEELPLPAIATAGKAPAAPTVVSVPGPAPKVESLPVPGVPVETLAAPVAAPVRNPVPATLPPLAEGDEIHALPFAKEPPAAVPSPDVRTRAEPKPVPSDPAVVRTNPPAPVLVPAAVAGSPIVRIATLAVDTEEFPVAVIETATPSHAGTPSGADVPASRPRPAAAPARARVVGVKPEGKPAKAPAVPMPSARPVGATRAPGEETVTLAPNAPEAEVAVATPQTVDATAVALAETSVRGSETAEAAPALVRGRVAVNPAVERETLAFIDAKGGGDGDHRVQIRIHPPELGAVDVRIHVRDRNVTMEMTVDNADVKSILDSNVLGMRQSLAERGLTLGQFNVGMSSYDKTDDGGRQSRRSERRERRGASADVATAPTRWTRNAGVVSEHSVNVFA